jgi:hypothetical protein
MRVDHTGEGGYDRRPLPLINSTRARLLPFHLPCFEYHGVAEEIIAKGEKQAGVGWLMMRGFVGDNEDNIRSVCTLGAYGQ